MQGAARVTYWLGWVCLALAVIARILTYTDFVERMHAAGVLPRNFFEFSVLFFIASIAGSMIQRQNS